MDMTYCSGYDKIVVFEQGNFKPVIMKNNEVLKQYYYVEKSHIHGLGLYARVQIKSGTYMGTYSGKTTRTNGTHVLWVEVEEDNWIGRDGSNILRYLNHSTEPCAEFDGYDLYAIRDIHPDEEITIDYGEDPT